MALGRLQSRSRQFVPPKLQITSMMDMFTIILIFLLFSFSESPETLELEKDLKLPESTAKLDYKEHIKLVLSQTSLKLGDKTLAAIKDGEIVGLELGNLKDSNLYKQLQRHRQEADKLKTSGGTDDPILFLCDKRLPFKTINGIVKAAGMAGYPNFQFAVLKK